MTIATTPEKHFVSRLASKAIERVAGNIALGSRPYDARQTAPKVVKHLTGESPAFRHVKDDLRIEPGRRLTNRRLFGRFKLNEEFVGEVRAVDQHNGTFTVSLAPDEADWEQEIVAILDTNLVGKREARQLAEGSMFDLVTGYRQVFNEAGELVNSTLETKIFFRQLRPVSEEKLRAAVREADELFDALHE
ncbi:hypothetical protein ACVU7I_02395 [Patulibacter sp. S7RM1-6]